MSKQPAVQADSSSLEAEFEHSHLGHGKRHQRLLKMVKQVKTNPSASFPDMAGSDVNRLYEFLANSHVTAPLLLQGHIAQTILRCQVEREVYIVTDTSEFCYGREFRGGLGPVTGGFGFLAHVALAVAKSGKVLGVLAFTTWVRPLADDPATIARKQLTNRERSQDPHRESLRWKKMVDEVAESLKDSGVVATYLADREGDDYPFIHSLVDQHRLCVVRVMHDRVLNTNPSDGAPSKLYDVMNALAGVVVREVPISERRAKAGKNNRPPKALATHPPRKARTATLQFAATTVTIKRPYASHPDLPKTLTVNVVHVTEPNPPEGQEPVEWRLITTMPIGTPAQIEAVVDAYRARWVIEEYFKALKTGCQIEKRQLEAGERLIKMTAFFLPVAYHLLLLRDVARQTPQAAATAVLTPTALEVLKSMASKPLPDSPTARDAYLAVAALGGHLKRNGDPGWLTLARGLAKLMAYAEGWEARGRLQTTR